MTNITEAAATATGPHVPNATKRGATKAADAVTKASGTPTATLRFLHLFSGPLRDSDLGNALKVAAASQGWDTEG